MRNGVFTTRNVILSFAFLGVLGSLSMFRSARALEDGKESAKGTAPCSEARSCDNSVNSSCATEIVPVTVSKSTGGVAAGNCIESSNTGICAAKHACSKNPNVNECEVGDNMPDALCNVPNSGDEPQCVVPR